MASFSYESEDEDWHDLDSLYYAAAEALHLNLNEQDQATIVYITLQLAESPYHMFEISRWFDSTFWKSQRVVSYSLITSDGPFSGTYNILLVRMETAPQMPGGPE